MKGLAILGSTGSIGVNTLEVAGSFPDRFRIVSLAAGTNLELLERQVELHRPELVAVRDADGAAALRDRLGKRCAVVHGPDGLRAAATRSGVDTAVGAIVGAAGLPAVHAAVDRGIDLALANKESLVIAGELLTRRAAESGSRILPVDSEHNALHQCLRGEASGEVRRIWLTASGGPFRALDRDALSRVTPEQALQHPTWRMGPKITVDSATLMNKGLEVIEARWLFDVEADRIRVVVHPQSVMHSMVEFVDGSFKAQLGVTDMRHPIQYALTWPERCESPLEGFDPARVGRLDFEEPDTERFPCLGLAFDALRSGGAAPAVLNAANEVAVQSFLDGQSSFMQIPSIIASTLARHAGDSAGSLEQLLAVDARARATASSVLQQGVRS